MPIATFDVGQTVTRDAPRRRRRRAASGSSTRLTPWSMRSTPTHVDADADVVGRALLAEVHRRAQARAAGARRTARPNDGEVDAALAARRRRCRSSTSRSHAAASSTSSAAAAGPAGLSTSRIIRHTMPWSALGVARCPAAMPAQIVSNATPWRITNVGEKNISR